MAITNFKGTPATLTGTELNIEDKAPEITIVNGSLEEIR